MYLYYIAYIARRRARARSRGAGRATGVAHLSIKYESITIHYPPNHPYIDQSIARTSTPRSPCAPIAIARRRTRAARSLVYIIKYESITYTLSPKTPIYRSITRTHQHPAIAAPDRDRAAPARRRRAISRLYKIRINHVYITPQNTHISINHTPQTRSRSRGAGASPTVSAASARMTDTPRDARASRDRAAVASRVVRADAVAHIHRARTRADALPAHRERRANAAAS